MSKTISLPCFDIEILVTKDACAGVNVTSPAYIEGIETAALAVVNHT